MGEDVITDNELRTIQQWPAPGWTGLMEYVEKRWKYLDRWTGPEPWNDQYGRQECRYRISTGCCRWNEDIITALEVNSEFWSVCWWSSMRGGHYEFRVPVIVSGQLMRP